MTLFGRREHCTDMRWHPVIAITALLLLPIFAFGQSTGSQTASTNDSSCIGKWFARVDETQSEQPHWITPVATTTPRLEEEFRYDVAWQRSNAGITAENYGGSKGLELIPLKRVEVIFSVPPYVVHNNPAVPNGFGDFQALIKYRLLSADEKHGNYILTAFFAVSAPTGTHGNGALRAILTPTIAYGKGFGYFDVQGTLGATLPAGDTAVIGRTYNWNNALQYRVLRKFWPEVEFNSSLFAEGKNDGKKQTFVTPGLVIGRLHIWRRLNFTVGGGFQIAATHFHTNNHNGILSLRLPF